MTDREWFEWCFRWWIDVSIFSTDTERARIDAAHAVPPKGWVP